VPSWAVNADLAVVEVKGISTTLSWLTPAEFRARCAVDLADSGTALAPIEFNAGVLYDKVHEELAILLWHAEDPPTQQTQSDFWISPVFTRLVALFPVLTDGS
jgi:hypothetical protein